MHKNIAIKVDKLTKFYKLYSRPIERLKESLHPFGKKYHKNFYATSDLSFEIKRGETVGIIGRNGSGKSTLLKMITGILTPSSGRVNVHGKISAILELGAGFNPEMTGVENIYLNTSLNGFTKDETDQIIQGIASFAELGEFIHQPIKTYSSGMKARLAFAVSINISPDILIVDEALSVGDAAFQRKCFAKMEQIREKGVTILFVSHSDNSIVSLCDRAIWLHNGRYILDGNPKLVTGLYQKYISENTLDTLKIQQEYDSLCQENTTIGPIHSQSESIHMQESFNPALAPSSTISYQEKGAKISDVKITTLNGEKINILLQGQMYLYSYKVTLFHPLKKVQFGFLIKEKNGSYLGGGVYPAKNSYIDQVDEDLIVNIKFKCELNNGEYFFNAGVTAMFDDEIGYAHRILDAYMIKVINANENITGNVNFIDSFSFEKHKVSL